MHGYGISIRVQSRVLKGRSFESSSFFVVATSVSASAVRGTPPRQGGGKGLCGKTQKLIRFASGLHTHTKLNYGNIYDIYGSELFTRKREIHRDSLLFDEFFPHCCLNFFFIKMFPQKEVRENACFKDKKMTSKLLVVICGGNYFPYARDGEDKIKVTLCFKEFVFFLQCSFFHFRLKV